MKLIIFCLSLLCVANCYSQMGSPVKEAPSTIVGKVTNMGTFIGQLAYAVDENKDSVYDLSFRNYKYTTITQIGHIRFSGEGHAVDSLYALMRTVFADENRKNKDYAVTVALGKQPISISTYRTMGTTTVMILNDEGHGLFTERQLDKLFGKQ